MLQTDPARIETSRWTLAPLRWNPAPQQPLWHLLQLPQLQRNRAPQHPSGHCWKFKQVHHQRHVGFDWLNFGIWSPLRGDVFLPAVICGICGTIGGRNYDFPKNALVSALAPKIQVTYNCGQQINVHVLILVHHKGHFVLKACPIWSS